MVMRKYKIIIIYSRSMESGGALRASYIAEHLEKRGHDVEFIKPLKRLPFQLDFPISFFYYMLKILFLDCDLIIVIKSYPNTCIPAIIKKLQDKKIILDIDDLDYAYRDGIMMHIGKILQKPFPRFFDAITVHNDNLREILIKDWNTPANKIFNLPQGIDAGFFNEKNVDNGLRKKLNLEGRKIIVFTAHLDVSTDIKPILEAVKIVTERIKNCTLVIAGRGPYLQNFKTLVEKMGLGSNVIFTGPFENQMIPSYIALGDVCIVYYEDRLANHFRTSMKIREYLAMKKPVACNDVGDLKQFKEYTYQSKTDVHDFADKIIEALLDKNNRSAYGYNYVIQNFSWDNIIETFEKESLEKLVSG
ncbi:Glycosyl transferases group 1 [uncultured archaeon]|nr:Glycosyl transferases group 1 [uncultured archaeon]